MKKMKVGEAEFGILARMLRGVSFFSPMTLGQLEQILPYIMLHVYEPGEVVFKQGEKGDAFYIVYQGRVEIKVKQGLFSSKAIAQLAQGQFFGEIALLSNETRTATVTCLDPSQLFVLVASDFQFVANRNPEMAAEMERIASRRKFDSKHQAS